MIGARVVAKSPWVGGANLNLNIHPPAADVTVTGPVYEGVAVTLDAGASSDWGSDIDTYAFDCTGDGTYEISQAGATALCTYPDNGVYTAGVKVVDDQGGEGTASTSCDGAQRCPDCGCRQRPDRE